MAEIRKEMKVYQVDMQCPECGEGFMRSNGFTLLTNPPHYQHTCDKCGFCEAYLVQYPTITYVAAKDSTFRVDISPAKVENP